MKTQELRIGNFVSNGGGTLHVTELDEHGATVVDGEDYASEVYNLINNFSPIPLTPEWLEKFGFEYHKYGGIHQYDFHIFGSMVMGLIIRYEIIEPHKDKAYYQGHTKMLLTDDHSEDFEDIDITETCKYVHQLQNLYFALTGTELTIKEHATK